MHRSWLRRAPLPLACLLALFFSFPSPPAAKTAALSEPLPVGASSPVIKNGLVVLVEFPGLPHDQDRDLIQQRFAELLDRYVRAMSYNTVSLRIDVTPKWYALPKPVAQYRISPRNLEVDKSRVVQLIDDALDSAGRDQDLGRYDFIVLMLGAKMQEYGMVGLCGYPGMLGWSSEDVFRTRSGILVRGGVAIFSSQAHLGTLFHDVAHILGGVQGGKRMVPCLYDHDLQAKPGPVREVFAESIVNMGYWDPMSCHSYRRELPPPGISSWTKLRLKWLDPAKVKVVEPGHSADIVLGPLEEASSEVLAVRIPLSPKTYYLIENRQPIGFDKNLPGSGVLIMYADDTVAECRHGKSPVRLMNADPSVPHLEGAAFDIGAKALFEDKERKLRVRILEKLGGSYRILVGPM